MPTMSAVTNQINLIEPALPYDRTNFGPHTTVLVSLAEQSRSTFKHVPGRISIILGHPEEFIEMDNEGIFERVLTDTKRFRIDLKDKVKGYRVVWHKTNFITWALTVILMRSPQETPLNGLTLAGDYTRQPFYATMESAVISNYNAALSIDRKKNLISLTQLPKIVTLFGNERGNTKSDSLKGGN